MKSYLEFIKSTTTLVKKIRSGVIHIQYWNNNLCIGSGSGFYSNGYLITNNHVLPGLETLVEKVTLAWQADDLLESRTGIEFSKEVFINLLKEGSDENSYDFAILDVPELRKQDLYSFTIKLPNNKSIGEEILILGFPLEHRNLVCHKGTISSFYNAKIGEEVSVKFIQLDASVNHSNSGGPLIDIITGDVIGIVTRKNTGLTKLFDKLLESFDGNIDILRKVAGRMYLGTLDPINMLITGQDQMKNLASEILRSANVGIGYAISTEYVLETLQTFAWKE